MAKQRIQNYVFSPGLSKNDNLYPNAYWLIQANKQFIKKEAVAFIASTIVSDTAVNLNPNAVALITNNKTFLTDEITAWIATQVAGSIFPFAGFTYDTAKCKRDVGYIIDAYIYDLRYGGQEKTTAAVRQYWLSGVAQIDGDRTPEVAAHTQLRNIINAYILTQTAYTTAQSPITSTQSLSGLAAEQQTDQIITRLASIVTSVIANGLSVLPTSTSIQYPYAVALISNNKTFLQDEVTAWIAAQVAANVPPFAKTEEELVKCERDLGYIIDAVGYDVALGTNYNAVFVGLAEYNSLDVTGDVLTAIENAKTGVAAITAVAANSTALTRANAAFDEIIDIASNGRTAANVASFTNPTSATVSQIAAKDKLIANKDFLAAEVNAWVNVTYPAHNHDEAKCTRDVKYAIDSVTYDILYGGNSATYDNAKFFYYGFADGSPGIDPTHKAQTVAAYAHLKSVAASIVTGTLIVPSLNNNLDQVTTGNNASPLDATAVSTLFEVIEDVVNTGLGSLPVKSYPSISWGLADERNAINNSKSSIITAVLDQTNYTYNPAKCKRDVGYILDAYLYDLSYGGNEKTRETISKYWIDGVAQVDGSRLQEVAAHTQLRNIINNFIIPINSYGSQQNPATSAQDQTGIEGEIEAKARITSLASIVTGVLTTGLSALPALVLPTGPDLSTRNFAGYIYDPAKCERDINYVLDAYLNDMRYGGNARTRFVVSRYWEGSQAQVDGDRLPEIVTHKFIRDLINNNIITQVVSDTPYQVNYSQVIDAQRQGETEAKTSITALSSIVTDVISYGLSSIPALVNGVSTIKIQGKHDLGSILLITNTVNNQIIYNFSDPENGGIVTYDTTYNSNGFYRDEDFPTFLQVADYVTTITLDADTSTSSITDDIQIFVETEEMKIRPYDFGTDAIERMRVAQPQSMLDADFEYGLQPTKWQAIGIARGYPSVYEIPGTDTAVVTVITDASVGTGGFGESLITVTTGGPHGFTVGTPITIRALANTISGFSRAEGTFIIFTVPSATTFTYYAVAKVGTSNGQVLATTYTQLRKGAFYTGASVGQPVFNVASNGTQVLITTVFDTPSGTDQLAWSGSALPVIGAPLLGTGMGSGAQITGVIGGGGLAASTDILYDAEIGSLDITVASAAGILEGMAIDNGSGSSIFVSSIAGTTISLTAPITTFRLGSAATYLNLAGTNIEATGAGATFDISRVLGEYTVTVAAQGLGYIIGNRIVIDGSSLDGVSGVNDITITVIAIDSAGEVAGITFTGTSVTGAQTYEDVSEVPVTYTSVLPYATSGSGLSALFDVTRDAGSYSAIVQPTNRGTGYAAGDTITIIGTDVGGATPTNDATITVSSVAASYTAVAQSSSSGSGTTATFNISRSGTIYSVSLANPGANYIQTEVITILGSVLGGVDVTNDLTITVDQIGGTGDIQLFSPTGTAAGTGEIAALSITGSAVQSIYLTSGGTYTAVVPASTTSVAGTLATFDVVRRFGQYNVSVADAGTLYVIGDTLTISGANVGGADPAANITVTVATVDVGGEILTVTSSGIAPSVSAGNGAIFDITRSLGAYSINITTVGTGYLPQDDIKILGSAFGGADVTNDLVIKIITVDGNGGIATVELQGDAITGNAVFPTQGGLITQPIGTGARFDISRASGVYSASVNNPGTDYFEGDQVLILGTSLGGTSPTNDAVLTVTSVSSNTVALTEVVGTAIAGISLDFYSTITFSELTTAAITQGSTITASAIATIEVIFPTAHGLIPGSSMLIDITSTGTNHELAKGPFYVESVPSLTTIRYTVRATGSIDTTNSLVGIVYARPDSYFIHRPYDGGVQLGTGGPQHGAQAIRMSKKYIRYQSGKGIMYTTGALFAPSYNLQNLSATSTSIGAYITVQTDDVDHGCQVGGVIKIIGVETAGYNGTYTVVDVINERTLRVIASTVLANTYASLGTAAQMSIQKWHGATVRAGTYDDQNGMFWQYDGKTLAVGRRSSTFQLAGVINIAKDTNLISGTNTRFRDQVKAGDRIVIKGMTHVVTNVTSNTAMNVTPDYRGASNAVQSKVCLVQDVIVPQSQFNLDKLDGTGPSGYNLDISKMQMIGLQWSWYGAGFIDYMLRGSDGNYVFAHRIRNSNVNTEAYMRTGNLPVRYEVINESAMSKLANSITAGQTTIPLVDASMFPDEAGIVYIENELIAFSGKSGNNLIGCTRSSPMTNFTGGAQRTFRAGAQSSHEYNTGVVLVSNTISPIISHWGSAFLTDGLFDEDRGYLFNYASTGISVSTTKSTAFLIRLAPSVSNAIVGDLGDRELLNRAQLLLKGIEVTSDTGTGGIVVEGVLNPQNYPLNPGDITWGGLAGLSAGGQPSFAQIAPGGSVNWNGGASQTIVSGTALNTVNYNLVVPSASVFARPSGTNVIYVTKASWDTSGATTGFAINDVKFPASTSVNSITASPAKTAVTLPTRSSSAQVYNGNGAVNFNPGSTQIWFTKASWEALTNPVSATGFTPSTSYFPSGTTVTSVSALQGSGSNQFYIVTMSQGSTAFMFAGTNIAMSLGGTQTNKNTVYFTSASWNALPIDIPVIGTTTNNTSYFAGGTTITGISALRTFAATGYYAVTFSTNVSSIAGGASLAFNGVDYYTLVASKTTSSAVSAAANVQLTLAQSTSVTNFVYLTQASWESAATTNGAGAGTEVSDAKFPAGTRISSVSAIKSFGGSSYYTITFNQTSNAVIAGAATIGFKFGLPPYALPGETVFSFIANPGERSSLDLSELKELTNTTLGGRGAFPNGPDVLAINVYKVSGTAIPSNIIIRWGEAQA